jgi:hypothetical protein
MNNLIVFFCLTVCTVAYAIEPLPLNEVNSIRQLVAPSLRDKPIVATLLPGYVAMRYGSDPTDLDFMKKDGSIRSFRYFSSNGRPGEALGEGDLERERAEQFRKMSKEQLVTVTYGDGSKKLLIISAFDCPYCKKLEGALSRHASKLNATIYYVPVLLSHAETAEDENLSAIWCAKGDKAKIWHDWWRGIQPPPQPRCQYTFEDRMALRMFFGAMGNGKFSMASPTIIREDGSRRRGLPDTEGNEFFEMFGGIR